MRLTVTWVGKVSASNCYMGVRGDSATNCYMGVRGDSATNCYMGARGTVRPTVTWEGEVKCDQLFHGRER